MKQDSQKPAVETNLEPIGSVLTKVIQLNAGKENFTEVPESKQSIHEQLATSPMFDDEVYKYLPQDLESMCGHFTGRGRDVFLLSSITLLSGIFYEVSGIYDRNKVFPGLFAFIVAPPASDKSVVSHARRMFNKLESELRSNFNLIIPGNSSASAIITQLEKNAGIGIICETEADSMANSLKQDWGNFSDILRKGFHHETIGQSRKANNEYLVIENPKIAQLLSGTLGQVPGIIKSPEDGLTSRIMFYMFSQEAKWRSVFPKDITGNLTDTFNEFGDMVLNRYKMLLRTEDVEPVFLFNDKQAKEFDELFDAQLNHLAKIEGPDKASILYRLGLIHFRIAMVLTCMRIKEVPKSGRLVCHHFDYEIAKSMVNTLLDHGLMMNKFLISEGKDIKYNKSEKLLINCLPINVTLSRSEIIVYVIDKIKIRSLDTALATLVEKKLLERPEQGCYKRVA